jgi:hypothetical protein
MEDRPTEAQSTETTPTPGMDPETGLIDRVPTQQELSAHYGSIATEATEAEQEVPTKDQEEQKAEPKFSATSAGADGPNTPWGQSTLTGSYRKLENGDLMIQITTDNPDPSNPMSSGRVAWVSLNQWRSGSIQWTATGFPGNLKVEVPA